jgi:sarcosine oxidase subunit gamma
MNAIDDMRRSFIHHRLASSETASNRFKQGRQNAGVEPVLELVDLSILPRWGVKGREAFAFLNKHGARIPADNNHADRQSDGSLIARLSPAEALILPLLPSGQSILAQSIESVPPEGQGACYPVPRRDSHCWFIVVGDAAPRMFAKLCGVDLAADQFAKGSVAQTSVARLSAIVIRQDINAGLGFSILADSASAEYLWDCLVDAMTEFSGATVKLEAFNAKFFGPID